MTHDELLADIDEVIEEFDQKYDNSNIYYDALRAVVELHSPCTGGAHDDSPDLEGVPCICVTCFGEAYPCETIQAIEKELQ